MHGSAAQEIQDREPPPAGEEPAIDAVFEEVYDRLRGMAHQQLQRETPGHSLDTTALVHEAYLSLVVQQKARFRDRGHFLAIAATAMRRILVDHARRHASAKRGGGVPRQALDHVDQLAVNERSDLLLALDEALYPTGGA